MVTVTAVTISPQRIEKRINMNVMYCLLGNYKVVYLFLQVKRLHGYSCNRNRSLALTKKLKKSVVCERRTLRYYRNSLS